MEAVARPRVAKVLVLGPHPSHTPSVLVVTGHLPELLSQVARANIEPNILGEIIQESHNLMSFAFVETSLEQ
ncbi:uncharacterized protein J3R85_018463 [Psidium guajava]|nr:uncharacterized protein J3R85_018463 [Psidium guajava]